MNVTALYPVLISRDPARSREFYADLLGFETAFESDWFVQLAAPGEGGAQLGLVAAGHDSIPPRVREERGVAALVTVEVDDAYRAFERVWARNLEVELPLRDEPWGQRHFIVRDPDGVAVDVVQVIAVADPEIAAQYSEQALPAG